MSERPGVIVPMDDALHEPVRLVEPDPEWPRIYADEATRITSALSACHPVVEHIGSTAVPLRAKPIIDIQVSVLEGRVPVAVDALRGLGYQHHGQGGVPEREYLTRRPGHGPGINVHVFATGNALLEDNRMIRDYLRAHPAAARAYEQIQQRAVGQGHIDLLSYSHAKGAHVAEIREAAYAWTGQAGT